MARRSHSASEAIGGREESPTPEARAGGREEQPEEWWLSRHRRAERSYPKLVRNGGSKEIPLVQGKEQHLCFAGAAMKRYLTPKVRETQVKG